jgi:DNA-binding transcriptional ArsR family regulator
MEARQLVFFLIKSINMRKSQSAANIKQFVDVDEIKKASLVLRSLNHDTRQKMLGLIHMRKKIMVTEIYKHLDMEQSQASSFLALMRKAGVVKTRREGQVIYYSVDHDRLSTIEKGIRIING